MKRKIADSISIEELQEFCSRSDIAKFKKSQELKERPNMLIKQFINMDDEVLPLINKLVNRIQISKRNNH